MRRMPVMRRQPERLVFIDEPKVRVAKLRSRRTSPGCVAALRAGSGSRWIRTTESSLFNFFRLRNADGQLDTPELERETVYRRRATREERETLFGRPEEVIEIERVRSLAGKQVTHEFSVISASLFPGPADRTPLPNTLYVFYQQAYSIIIIRANEPLKATPASPQTVDALGLTKGIPVLEVRRQSIDVLDRVVELRLSQILTQSYDYSISLS